MADVKICGLTRGEDAVLAARGGARWLGVIFAGGPRKVTVAQARKVFRDVPREVRRVGVVGPEPAGALAQLASDAGLDVLQLHGDPTPDEVSELRTVFKGVIWPVVRVADRLPPNAAELARRADGVLLDTRVEGMEGGTGRAFDWEAIAESIEVVRADRTLVLAGGLDPDNVARAIEILAPDIVDVSSGVERSPGIKNPEKVSRFIEAARQATLKR